MIIIFRKNEKELYQKSSKAEAIKMLITISLAQYYATFYNQTLEELPRTLLSEKMMIKVQKDQKKLTKLQIFLKIADINILRNIPLH